MSPNPRDVSVPVDLILTVGIVLVILLHAATEPYQIVDLMSPKGVSLWWTVNIYNSLSRTCIPLFIMLSGVLLLKPGKLAAPVKVFFKKRLNRIGLPFLFWGVAYFAWRFFVNQEPFSVNSIFQGILTGPYRHFWFLYLIAGLYLITPLLRVFVAYADRRILRYFFVIWFLGTSIIPLLGLFGNYSLNANLFLITGWVGYFILGSYMLKVQLRSMILYISLLAGLAWTIIGSYIIVGSIGERTSQFFYDAYSFNIVLASVALFLLLSKVSPITLDNRFPRINKLLSLIGRNTLAIYLLHVMVLESLQKGYLGFKISLTTMDPVFEIPLITALTLLICLAIVYPLKKVPGLKRIIG